jgi:hypothetical protein
MKKIIILLLCSMGTIFAQDAPKLEFFCELQVKLSPALSVGETAHGTRRIIPIIGGTVEGPGIKGEIFNGGADWQVVRKDGVAELEAHYQFKTDDGSIVYVKNIGVRVATPDVAARIARGEKVDASQYYFRAIPKLETSLSSKYAWINDTIFVCTGERLPDAVKIRIYKLL